MQEFNKKYDPGLIENEISRLRQEQDFSFNTKEQQILISLPLLTATPLHLGHAASRLLPDVLAKYYHMLGTGTQTKSSRYYGSFLTNEKIQHQLQKIGTSRSKISKGQFRDVMRKQIKKQKTYNTLQLQKLGINIAENQNLNFGITFSRFIRKMFYDLIQNDTIYEAEDIVYRDTKYQTSVGQDEIRFEKQKGKKYTIKYFISTKNNSINVITTSPETMFGDIALGVHPDNKRYHNLVGQKAIIPIINKVIPIIADERVDMFANNGIMRITPAHDLLSLRIAKDHKLPTENFAIDQQGYFTKLAGDHFGGKKVDEFTKNIIQNLDDIDNLVSTEDCIFEIPVCKKTGERPQTMCMVQRFLNIEKSREKLKQMLDTGDIKIFPNSAVTKLKENLDNVTNRCISKKYVFGQNLPIWISEKKGMIYILDESDVLQSYKKAKNKKKPNVLLSWIVFNLIADGRLDNNFQMEDLINILLLDSLESGKNILETYIDILEKEVGLYKPQIKDLKEILNYAGKGKNLNTEKFAAFFIKLLDSSFALQQVFENKYEFDADKLISADKGLKQEPSKFDISFVNSISLLQSLGLLQSQKSKQQNITMTVGENALPEIIKLFLLSLQLTDKLPFDTIWVNKMVTDKKQKKMGVLCDNNVDPNILVREFGADTTRLYLMTAGDDHLIYDQKDLASYDELLNKRWNACRYVSLRANEIYGKKKININTLEKEIEKEISHLQDFDLWILNKIKNLYQDIDGYIFANNITEFGAKLLTVIKNDFCDKYLEISKNIKSKLTDKVMLLAISKLLNLLYPYAPFITEKIRILMNFNGFLGEQKIKINFLENISKNYKIQLFMDIVDKFVLIKHNLGGQKHTAVDAFIKANPDFLRFTKSNENTIKKILNINKIDYLNTNEENLRGYTTQDIIDITVGIKMTNISQIIKPKGLAELKQDLEKQKQYLQYIKNIIGSMITNKSDEKQIENKRKEINKVKKIILELEYEIKKMKAD